MKKEVLNNSFVFYATNLEVIETLEETDKELANDFMKAIIEYGIYGEYENTNPIIKVLMVQAGFGIDKAKDRYATAVENGKKGGRPKKEIDNDVLSVMRDKGMSYQEIADKLGVSKSTIQRRFKEIDSSLVSNGVKTQNLNDNVNDNENENENVKVNAKNRKNRKNLNDNVNVNVNDNENVNIIDKDFLPTEENLDGFAIEPVKQENISQNNEDADGTISKCGAQFQNVYNIKEINNNNKKEIDKGDFVATPVRKNELPTPQMRNTNSAKTNSEVRKNGREIDNINNINNIDIGDFVASQQNPATSLASQVSSVKQVEAVGADKVITINCSDMRDSYYHLYKYLAKYQPALASFVVNGLAFCRSNKERTDKAIEICNTYGYTVDFNDTAVAVANV